MNLRELLPRGCFPTHLDDGEVEDLIFIGRENLKIILDRWEMEADAFEGMTEALGKLSSGQLTESEKTVFHFLGMEGDLENLEEIKDYVKLRDEAMKDVNESIGKKIGLSKENVALLTPLIEKAESKPVFPFFRDREDLQNANKIFRLLPSRFGKPRWIEKTKETKKSLLSICRLGCMETVFFGISQICIPNDPHYLSGEDLGYLKKNPEYAKIWVNSTMLVLKHNERRSILRSFHK